MLQFVLGAIFGGFIAFVVIAIVSINKADEEHMQPTPTSKETGEKDAPSE